MDSKFYLAGERKRDPYIMFYPMLDFDCEGEPPGILIVGPQGVVAKVFLKPTCTKYWSWKPDDWELPECVIDTLDLLNFAEETPFTPRKTKELL